MIPSLVAGEVRRGIVEYLTTTFALADDTTRAALTAFLEHGDPGDGSGADADDGIFRGPYLRVRPPFKPVDDGWVSPLGYFPADWEADGIRPHKHQGDAWERLAGRTRTPLPTILTTGTGSGKTEGFEIPILDHVMWARGEGQKGIKALILYPMNALASDQAGRFARRIDGDPALTGIRVGMFAGESGDAKTMSGRSIINNHSTIVDDPPDILITNYKALDRLLVRADRAPLWAANTPDTIRYVVLDEFHTYDGAQGTDVAMLLRRLGARLGMADTITLSDGTEQVRPLGGAVPVATSATLASTPAARADLLGFAHKVFGVHFDDAAVIGETRKTAKEAVGTVSVFSMPDPTLLAKLDPTNPAALIEAADLYCGTAPLAADGTLDTITLGKLIRGHYLMEPVLRHAGKGPTGWVDVAERVARTESAWGKALQDDPADVAAALAWFVALVSVAREARLDKDGNPKTRDDGTAVTKELFQVEVQMWIREVSHLLRRISPTPTFRWLDTGQTTKTGQSIDLPSVYCRHCGRSGWAAEASLQTAMPGVAGPALKTAPSAVYQASLTGSDTFRAFIHADPSEDEVVWLSGDDGQAHKADPGGGVPVLMTPSDKAGKDQQCPSCLTDDAMRFLGSAVTSLASVTISQLFGSAQVSPGERKLIAFTDSVQDAAHRAGFFSGRAHKFNLRVLLAGHLAANPGPVDSEALANAVMAAATTPRDRVQIMPPDLDRVPSLASLTTDIPDTDDLDTLRLRVLLDTHLELGLRSQIGRTLGRTSSAVAWVDIGPDDATRIAGGVAEYQSHEFPQQPTLDEDDPWADPDQWRLWLHGLLERARARGAIAHPWFTDYFETDNPYRIWGGRPDGMIAFPGRHSRPSLPATHGKSDSAYDRISRQSWWADWTARVLGIEGDPAAAIVREAFRQLSNAHILDRIDLGVGDKGGRRTAWVIPAGRLLADDITETNGNGEVACRICHHRQAVPAHLIGVFDGSPCLRYRCTGHLETATMELGNYYRSFYRTGDMRRVIARPHTGHLDTKNRERLERDFRKDAKPDAPNVLTATPTLEMGIDIGDLSAVMLTSVPRTLAAHAQRIGRAGRITGNSLITTFVGTDPMSLYYLADPELMLAGDILPPDCNLDAGEILNRHLLAYFVDLHANGKLFPEPMPPRAGKLMGEWGKGGWLDQIVKAVETSPATVTDFLGLFGGHVSADARTAVIDYAASGLRTRTADVVDRWRAHLREYENRSERMYKAIQKINAQDKLTKDDKDTVARLSGERKAVDAQKSAIRRQRTLDTLERSGLLPNYTLTDDTVTFDARLWYHNPDAKDKEDEFPVIDVTVDRSVDMALTELAPGATFYAGAYKLTVDTIDIGPSSEPMYRSVRLCPDCGWGTGHSEGDQMPECKGCKGSAIAGLSNVHRLLVPSRVSTVVHEPDARIYDESDDRTRRQFNTVRTVHFDPTRIPGTWFHDHTTFAFEYCDTATIRTVNVGPERAPMAGKVTIGGRELNAPMFDVCRHCGIVKGVRRPDRDGNHPHHGFCTTRKGKAEEKWEAIGLYHETVTEAVRVLLPIGDGNDRERIASFKALLMLGLRRSFGGNPDHLRIIETDFPSPDPNQRQHHLVIHDTVTGGTGYITRLTDPDTMRDILADAMQTVGTCPCTLADKKACHRCLLSVADRRDIPYVSRQAALELIDPVLQTWSMTNSATNIVATDVSEKVSKSELELRFKKVLRGLNGKTLPSGIACEVEETPAQGGHTQFDIRLTRNTTTRRWRISEQVSLTPEPGLSTKTDFHATRLDATSPPVAIYLDGFRYHASAEYNRLTDDADKRDALRDNGTWVWAATYDDVNDVLIHLLADTLPKTPAVSAFPKPALTLAEHPALSGGPVRDRTTPNPVLGLLEHLADPDGWDATARAVVLGWVKHLTDTGHTGGVAKVTDPWAATNGWADTGTVPEQDLTGKVGSAAEATSETGLPILLAGVNPPAGPVGFASRLQSATADVDQPGHRARWSDWLHLANVMQFLDGGDRHRAATTTPTTVAAPQPDDQTADDPAGLADAAAEQVDNLYLADDDIVALVVAAVTAGAPLPEPGHEPADGVIVEAAWPNARAGILIRDMDPDDVTTHLAWAAANHWTLHQPDGWTADTLLDHLKDN